MRSMLATGIVLIAAALATPAFAEERPIELKAGAGKEAVETNCASCHSLDYIQMNSPFMNGKVWEAEVNKMIKVFGAPIQDADAKLISDYLTATYGG